MTDRARTIMYTQQLDYLKGTDLTEKKEKLIEKVKKLLKSPKDEIAISFHDRDPETAPHVHVGMHFFNPRSINQLCKILDDRKEQFTIFKGRMPQITCGLIFFTVRQVLLLSVNIRLQISGFVILTFKHV